MTSLPIEARSPPRNALAGRGPRGRLLRAVQRFADLQVASVSRDIAPWLAARTGAVLEVGCGDQPYRALVPPHCRYTGVDHGALSSQFAMQTSGEVVYYAGDRFPAPDAQFESLFHTEVLEHVFDTATFLRECRRVLKHDGELFFTVPFQARYHFIPNDYYRFTPAALERLLAQAGFAEVAVTPRGGDITVAAYKVAAVGFRWAYGDWRSKLLFVAGAPLTLAALLVAHLSTALKAGSTDDCLGYTVTARAA